MASTGLNHRDFPQAAAVRQTSFLAVERNSTPEKPKREAGTPPGSWVPPLLFEDGEHRVRVGVRVVSCVKGKTRPMRAETASQAPGPQAGLGVRNPRLTSFLPFDSTDRSHHFQCRARFPPQRPHRVGDNNQCSFSNYQFLLRSRKSNSTIF